MPWASHLIAVNDSFCEWATIVRARCADGKKLVSDASDEHGFSERVAKEFAAGLDHIHGDARGEVRA
jgi:hypothetical protein